MGDTGTESVRCGEPSGHPRIEWLHAVEGDDDDRSAGHRMIITLRADGVNDMAPTNRAIDSTPRAGFHPRPSVPTMVATLFERTDVDVRIGVTQAPRELTLELPDDLDREALKTKIEAALSCAVDVLWLTDKRNRDVGVCSAKIAYIEIGTPEGDRKIGFGG